jgi:hypothetical protein
VKYGSARKYWQKFPHKLRAPSRQTIHNLVNEPRTMGLSIHKKEKQASSAYCEVR